MKILCVFGRHAYGDPARGEGYEHANFIPALRSLGHDVALFDSFDRSSYADFAELNQRLVETVLRETPDILFCVLMQYEIWVETLDLIRSRTPTVVVHWGTDDSWKFDRFSRFIARHVDLHVTTSLAAGKQAARLGLDNVMASQWAVPAARLLRPMPAASCRYGCSFVGAAYGNRRTLVASLQAAGIEVACFGHGWPNGPVSSDEVVRIFNGSKLSLNFADSGLQWSGLRPYRSRQIKARTFEVPGAGGVLVTQAEPTLAEYFDVGREIVVFDGARDLPGRVRQLLGDDAQRDRIAEAAHERVRRQHTYEQRFAQILAAVEPLRQSRSRRPNDLTPAMLSTAVAAYRRPTRALHMLSALKGALDRLPNGKRVRRAMRRILFELSWRTAGEATYRAKGLPGRAFYEES